MSLLPVALYGLEVPAGDVITPAVPDFPATFRITMAAIDPSASIDAEQAKRATLKLIRQPIGSGDEDDSEEESDEESYMNALLTGADSNESSDEEEDANGGPSDPTKSKKARKAAALDQLLSSLKNDEDEDDEMEDAPNGINGVTKSDKKGKAKASDDRDKDEDSEEDDEDDLEIEEFVICTLDPEKLYQQPLDITIGEEERVFFKVSGGYSIHLTGNYVIPDDQGHGHDHGDYDSEEDEDDEYDLPPDDHELMLDVDDESDELDDLEDPRITEVESEEEAPKLVSKTEKKQEKKGKNKRGAEALEEADTLDDLIAKAAKPAEVTTKGEQKLSKKQLKKLKNNSGEAVLTKAEGGSKGESAKDASQASKADKKVQFAQELEQGPSGSSDPAKNGKPETEAKDGKNKATLGVKTVQGVKVDDREIGSGPAAKKGDRVGMRYIGKLTDGKVFDSNKNGKPFSFKLGVGEVVKGWDIGVTGMSVGGQRRLTIPPHLAYGNKSLPGIPANSTLIFDIKLLKIQ